MRKNNWYSVLQWLSYFTQLGLSVAVPIVLCIMGAWWLNQRAGVGAWVYLPALALGLGGGFVSARDLCRAMLRHAQSEGKAAQSPKATSASSAASTEDDNRPGTKTHETR